MQPVEITRRIALLGALSGLGGCGAVSALNAAAETLDTYDLSPVAGTTTGPSTSRTLLVARPDASAAIATDRIMVKPDAVSITYLPDARWSDEAPLMLQSLLIRSLSATGRVGYVGRSDGGPVPDTALLVRMDAFQAEVLPDGGMVASVDIELTLVDDRDQHVIAGRRFTTSASVANDSAAAIVAAFQAVLDRLLPAMADWTLERA